MKKLFTSIALVFLFLPLVSFAQIGGGGPVQSTSGSGPVQSTFLGGPNQATSGSGCTSSFCFQNPLNFETICGLLKQLLSVFLTLGTPVAALFLVYAGFKFVVARGNPTKLGVAKNNLLFVVIGICIFLGAWLMGQLIANTINTIAPGTVNTSASCR